MRKTGNPRREVRSPQEDEKTSVRGGQGLRRPPPGTLVVTFRHRSLFHFFLHDPHQPGGQELPRRPKGPEENDHECS